MRLILFILIALALVSCSSERKAQYHVKKALKHGAKFTQDTDTIRIATVDSFPVIVNDSIVWEKIISYRDTVIIFRTLEIPKTKFQTKIEFRERIKTLKIKGDTEVKIVRQQAKVKNNQIVKYRTNWWLILIAFILGFVLRFILNSSVFNRIALFLKYRGEI
jgi:PBP1b-binding outer membrane lipoprotein LpoB